jgi:hypothetical protein
MQAWEDAVRPRHRARPMRSDITTHHMRRQRGPSRSSEMGAELPERNLA